MISNQDDPVWVGFLAWAALNTILLIVCLVRKQWFTTPRVFTRHGYTFQTGRFPLVVLDETVADGQHVKIPLGPCPVVIDVGGHYGSFAVHTAAQYGAEVHVFEPITELANHARANARHNYLEGQIHVVNAAVGECARIVPMKCYPSIAFLNSVCSEHPDLNLWWWVLWHLISLIEASIDVLDIPKPSTYRVHRWMTEEGDAIRLFFTLAYTFVWTMLIGPSVIIVWLLESPIIQNGTPMIPLSRYIREKLPGRTVSLLKIDVEGYGYEVLLGIDDADWKNIQMVNIECEGHRKQPEMIQLLENYGFDVDVEWDGLCDQIHARRNTKTAE